MAVTAVIGLGSAAYQFYKGKKAEEQAAELARKAGQRPEYKTPQGEYDNLALLQSRASQGLSDNTLNALNSGNERGFSTAVSNILMNGGSQNQVSGLYDKYNNSLNKIALADDAQKVQNINNYIQQKSRMSAFSDKNYQLNELDPWKDQNAAANRMSAYGNNQQTAAIGTASSALIGAAGSLSRSANPNATTTPDPAVSDLTVTNYSAPIGPQPDTNPTNVYLAGMDLSTINPETQDAVLGLLQPNYNQTSFY